ncbi:MULTISPECIES: SDR family oxidoreductase [Streptomyces]|uniref:SDR family oxidoreductase n=2 Tax=Streptomyces TaxID=1883 RepID=A0ABU2RR65_9ACTN|nr:MULTISPECIES: SDR family oxidoreductase [unclassified Streptomyces]MBK3592075.1 SDR family oxidoreductase [Streptomyces sp. MBT51]MDT0431010.1 SDR family oxidoreductase [Streptomyces sp. DSM 41770]
MAAVDTDVVVVGAGPVGLMLAGELRLGGAEVTVLEQRDGPTTESRASTLHARTMELFDQRGLLDDLGTPPHVPMGHFGGIPLDLRLDSPFAGQWKVPQTRTEELLGAWSRGLGAELRGGHRVRSLGQHHDRVEVEADGPHGPVRLSARYVVGCDGERSTVRELAGIPFPGTSAGRELIRADADGLDIQDRRFQRLEKGLAIAARGAGGTTRVMVHRFGRPPRPRTAEPDYAELADVWRTVTGEDITAGVPLWVNSFGDASRQAARYRAGRVLLAGDAAHQQMPIGGQALNLGLQDAVNLGWKLAAVVLGRAHDALLESYHEERHAVGREVLSGIRAQARLLLGGPEVESLRSVMGELIAYEDVRRHLAGTISGLGIRYGSGPGHPLCGTRLPPAAPTPDTTTTSTVVTLRRARGLLLHPASGGPGPAEAAAPWADRVDAVVTDAASTGPTAGGTTVLVRPDGHVAWAGSDEEGLLAALDRWFGSPAAGARRHSAQHTAPRPGAHTTSSDRRHVRRSTMGNLTGRTALVTGSSRGMGRATAERLAREGALVAVHYATGKAAAEEVVSGIESDGGRAFAVRSELGAPGGVHELFLGLEQGLKERTGSSELNIVVNNAGVMGGVKPEDTTPEQFDRLVAVNAKAPFFVIQRALPNMPDGGRIINISSGLTRFANPDEIAYAMTKGAVEMLALHYAKYLGPRGITVNSVAPGITRNGNPVFDIPEAVEQMAALSTFNRVGEPQDVADVVAFLASDDARWVTGAFIDASGGTLLG